MLDENIPFLNPSLTGRYVAARKLKKGDQLLSRILPTVVIDSVVVKDTLVRVYNFEVAQWHNYLVGQQAVLVHNAKCGDLDEFVKSYNLDDIDGRIAVFDKRLRSQLISEVKLLQDFQAQLSKLSDNAAYKEYFRKNLLKYFDSQNSNLVEQTFAWDLLEGAKVNKKPSMNQWTKQDMEDMLTFVSNKISGTRYLEELSKLKLSKLTDGLSSDIDNYRRINSIPITEESGGAVALGKGSVDVNGNTLTINNRMGASPVARSKSMPPKANDRYINTDAVTKVKSTNNDVINHAEQDLVGNIAYDIDNALRITPGDMSQIAKDARTKVTGKIYIYVDRKVCSQCTAGFNSAHSSQGSLYQFSEDFPGVEIIVVSPKEKIKTTTLRQFKIIDKKLTDLP